MRTLTRKLLTAGVAATGLAGVAPAEEPGPTVRIRRVTAGPLTRAAAPDDRPAYQATPGWLAGPTSTAVRPLTGAEQAAAASVAPVKKPSLAEGTFSGVKSFISPAPTPGQVPTPTPLPQGMQPRPQYAASPGVYAGPPAYRWYGYGAVTPGRNPHAPEGVSPRGSPNWYAQSGATPGAFPVTVTANGQIASGQPVVPRELPSYTLGHVASSFDRPAEPPAPVYPAPTPVSVPTPAPGGAQPLPATVTAGVEPASLATPFTPAEPTPTPLPTMSPLPVVTPPPTAEPQPTLMPTVTPPPRLSEPPAFNPTAAAAPAPATEGPQPLLTWSGTSTDPAVTFTGSKSPAATSVVAVSPPPAATVTPVAATVAPVAPTIVPASAVVPVTPLAPAVATPTWGAAKPVGRSQGPADPAAPTLDQAIRNAAYGFATVAEVRHTGPSAVTVRLQAATAADARSAAELVSKLPALKPLAVDFAVTISAPPQAILASPTR